MNITTLAEQLKAARKSKGISQTELAERAGVSRFTVSQLELARLPEIGLGKLSAITEQLDLALCLVPQRKRPSLRDSGRWS